MPAKSFLRRLAGKTQQVFGTVISAGVANDGDIPALDATGRLHVSVLPIGVGADTASVLASEALPAGSFVNVYSNAGVANARRADGSTTGKEAVGFVLSAVDSGNNALVYFEGQNTQLTGLVAGTRYYLGTTPGAPSASPLTTPGQVDQYLGVATSATAIAFEGEDGVLL